MREVFVKKAVSRFMGGHLCSEAVLMTSAEFYGIKTDVIPKIAKASELE